MFLDLLCMSQAWVRDHVKETFGLKTGSIPVGFPLKQHNAYLD